MNLKNHFYLYLKTEGVYFKKSMIQAKTFLRNRGWT